MIDVPKLLLLASLALLLLAALWAALDRRSAAAAAARRGFGSPWCRRALVAALLVLAFLVVVEDVLEGERDELVLRVDAKVVSALTPPSPVTRKAAGAVSSLTGTGVLVGTVAAVLVLAALRRRRDAVVLALVSLGAWAIAGLFKALFLVPRPRAQDVLRITASYGFPSGHALVTLVICGTLAWLIGSRSSLAVRAGLMLGAWTLAVGGGISRVVLRAHWASDVAGGLILGALWLVVLPLIVRKPAS